jgi:hypothetical protein
MLVCVRQEDASVFAEVPEAVIPQHVRDYVAETDARAARGR